VSGELIFGNQGGTAMSMASSLLRDGAFFVAKPVLPGGNTGYEKIVMEEKTMQELNELKEKIAAIKQEILTSSEDLTSSRSVYEFKKDFLDSKQGKLSQLMKEMRNIPNESKAEFGKAVNAAKEWAVNYFDELDEKLKAEELKLRYESEKIDITMPPKKIRYGNLHPITTVRSQLTDIFASMGFEVYEGTEIETDFYNFTALNTPQDHPARDMQDTFYLSPEFLLRTQTSAGQIHVMEKEKPPIKVISPGKVFRSDDDATHSPMFSQMEGLVVDEGITLCDLKGMLDMFVKRIFGESVTTRLRPSYFPFTEPSVEVDVSCFQCGGKGCKLCKNTGWIEVLGAGVVNKKVLENCGIDSEKYSGFAFGLGLERIAMLKYGINNIKLLFESDLRVLDQIDD
jgi:phenylalanyl-tRNA synthetase alpha chain